MSKIAPYGQALLLAVSIAAAQDTTIPVSPADRRIAAAQRKIKSSPNSAQSYNDLAFAYCRKARDTEDPAVYQQAENALKTSFQLTPENYDARKLQAAVLLGEGKFAEALKLAADLNHNVPDDIAGWGLLVDANMALGNNDEAERDAQWILDLRAGSTLGFEKAAALREVFGDISGAIEFLDEANRRTSQNDSDQHAWLLTQKARLTLTSGGQRAAEELLNQAFNLYPDSQLALAVLAKLRLEQGKYPEAAALFGKKYRAVQTPANLHLWTDALAKSGQNERTAAAANQSNR